MPFVQGLYSRHMVWHYEKWCNCLKFIVSIFYCSLGVLCWNDDLKYMMVLSLICLFFRVWVVF